MFPLVESLKILDGKVYNIEFHNERINRTRRNLFNLMNEINLLDFIKIEGYLESGFYKCRVVYSNEIEMVEFLPYSIKKIDSLKIVYSDDIDYTYKYADKEKFNKLLSLKNLCDDILIVKNGYLTDTSFSNIVLFDGVNYFTPDTPLLKGTKREYLLKNKTILEKTIKLEDLKHYKEIFMINALIDLFQCGTTTNNVID